MARARKTLQPEPEPEPLNTYGIPDPSGILTTQFRCDAAAFATRRPISTGCPMRFNLFKSIANQLVPGHFEWHGWTEKVVRELCGPDTDYGLGKGKHKTIILRGFPGCSNSAKTFNAVSFACIWWLTWPDESSVTLVSTSKNSLRRRGWSVVQSIYSQANAHLGNFVDSRMLWQWTKGNDKNAIVGKAVEEGSVQKVADDIKGVHTRRQMVIVDEATSVPEAILEACANLYSYPDEFILCLMGNPLNRLDQFGKYCEPKDGWKSVDVDSGEWDAKGFDKCGGECPHVVTFDAEKSPNILEDKLVSRHLPMKHVVEAAKSKSGGGQSPHYWQNMRGFWPPEGLIQTVFTPSSITKFGGDGHLRFTGFNFRVIGALDPAFGGDRAVLRFAAMGDIEHGIIGLQLLDPIILELNVNSNNPIRYQIVEQVKQYCERIKIGPHEFTCPPSSMAIDDTSGGVGDIARRTWDQKVNLVVFQGEASDIPVSLEDTRPANEVYKNKRSEMYFHALHAMESGQLKGLDPETQNELCNMAWEMSGAKIKLMDKKDYRKQFGKSPDLADSAALIMEAARLNGFRLKAVQETQKIVDDWQEQIDKEQEVFETIDYMSDEVIIEDDVLV